MREAMHGALRATIPISTSDGTKVADAAWMSPARRAILKERKHQVATLAPEMWWR